VKTGNYSCRDETDGGENHFRRGDTEKEIMKEGRFGFQVSAKPG
jgi:hypothetical protein